MMLAVYLALLFVSLPLTATIQEGSIWSPATFFGHKKSQKKIEYYVYDEVRYRFHPEKVLQGRVGGGIGYKYSKLFTVVFGYVYINEQRFCEEEQENRFLQEVVFDVIETKKFELAFRTRIEELKVSCEPEWATRLREKVILQWPHGLGKLTPVISEEIFIFVNKPHWVEDRIIDQNRFFVGVRFKISKRAAMDIGYLNQYRFRDENISNNVLSIQLKITLD